MVSRTIVTSQPEVACDVCARRLLRGEQPEIFLTAGRRATVCELCAPRAASEGWLREVDHDPVSLALLRPRRGRSLLGRLRKGTRAVDGPLDGAAPGAPEARATEEEPQPYDFLGGGEAAQASTGEAARRPAAVERRDGLAAAPIPVAAGIDSDLQHAISLFNRGEYPRRVAGVARSLGVAEVSVIRAEADPATITIVIAWELCWYRYEVDLREAGGQARVVAQGTTLEELAEHERKANAAMDDRGALSLID